MVEPRSGWNKHRRWAIPLIAFSMGFVLTFIAIHLY